MNRVASEESSCLVCMADESSSVLQGFAKTAVKALFLPSDPEGFLPLPDSRLSDQTSADSMWLPWSSHVDSLFAETPGKAAWTSAHFSENSTSACSTPSQSTRGLSPLADEGGRSLSPPPGLIDDFSCQLARAEEDLVDIDPTEGRRRGTELMAMLLPPVQAGAQASSRTRLSRTAKPFQPGAAAAAAKPAPSNDAGVLKARLSATTALFQSNKATAVAAAAAAAAAGAAAAESRRGEAAAAERERSRLDLQRLLLEQESDQAWEAALRLASTEVLRGDLVDVQGTTQDGFVLRIAPGADALTDRHAFLERLAAALWAQLGQEMVSYEAAVLLKRATLTLRRLHKADLENSCQRCWEFSQFGVCRRGDYCKWPHTVPRTSLVDIDIVY
eukprot:TRINITY_DN330_c1_g1_i1.p1 TRINITY_DN330_c1_g1~~TRINITY_DN330_c1_g1_i1.p1  ORF type:complete len:427 (+),score=95.61 TRINITY_DN330_c1_g1_i1:120-1283(+)